MSKIGVAKSATTVRYGPNATLYASVGSIDANESVVVHGKENGWYCISYSAGNTLKRGFVPTGTFTNESELSTESIITSGCSKTAQTAQTVYTGPIPSNYAVAGYISAGEIVTAFLPAYEDYTYIEYGTGNGVKRGYVLTSALMNTKGKLAIMSAKATVYFGPSTNYVASGSIASGEYCVIISCERPFGSSAKWCQIEYISGSSRKRGYINQGGIIPFGTISSLSGIKTVHGNAMMLANCTVYTGPGSGFIAAGSVSQNEVVQTLGSVQETNGYMYIEYSTASGKKRGYVTYSNVSEEVLFSHTMAQATTVYSGPDTKIYASIGSVAANEDVEVIAKEADWFEINYVGLTQFKRGFVPATTLQNSATIAGGLSESNYTGYLDMTTTETSVYSGPADSYAAVGSLAANEGVTVISGASDGFCHIEYSTPTGTKRGYILQTTLAHKTRGILGKVNQDTSAYFGASTSSLKSGGVFADEYVVVLDRETSSKYSTLWYYVEFNAASGRKRGYVNQSDVILCGTGASLDDLKIGDHLAVAKMDLTVYSGPSESYARVGTISETERVSVYEGRSQESEYAFIEYCTPAGPKMGYVPAGQLLKTSFGIPVPNTTITPTVYGTSGTGKHSLKYYRIGTGPHVLVAVFAIHGYEDAWAADGLELCKLANQLIETLAAEAADWKSTWSVYIFPAANPDGITDGYTHNGPGRTTVSTGVDANRCFPVNFVATYTARNYTGSTSLYAPEAQALYTTLKNIQNSAATMRLLDIHGWLNTSYGDSSLSAPFCAEFGFGNQSVMGGKGYLSRWAISTGMSAALIELPFPYSIADISDKKYFEKLNTAIHGIFELQIDVPDNAVLYSKGSVGEEVGVLQAFLKYNGYLTADVTEYYGGLTYDAVKAYQTANSIAASGKIDGITLTTMGFSYTNAGTIQDNNAMYRDYLWKAQFYQSYQHARTAFEDTNYYVRNITLSRQLFYDPTGSTGGKYLRLLTGESDQEVTIKKTSSGFVLASKNYPNQVLTYDTGTGKVTFGIDGGLATQRWSVTNIEDQDAVCSFINIDASNQYLMGVASSDTLQMGTQAHCWSIRKATYAKRVTSAMKAHGVLIQYSKDVYNGSDLQEDDAYEKIFPDSKNYTNYYLDYTSPVLELLDSQQSFYEEYKVLPYPDYIEKLLGQGVIDLTNAPEMWLALLVRSFLAFFYLVKNNADMDLKVRDRWNERFDDEIPYIAPWLDSDFPDDHPYKVIIDGKYRTSEHIGNITYGYMGTLLGFGEELLLCAGGAASLAGAGGLLAYPEAVTDAYNIGAPFYGDPANDHNAVKEGIALAKKRHGDIQIGYELPEDMEELAKVVNVMASTIRVSLDAIIEDLKKIGYLRS